MKKGKIITVFSGKGGIGKTIFATNLAGVYSSLKYKTLLIDFDLTSGGISVLLNLPKSKTIYNLADDILNNRFKENTEYVYHYDECVDVIPACKDPREGNRIDSKILEQILAIYKNHYDIIILDTNHIPNNASLTAIDKADTVLFMITDNPLDLKNATNLLTILKRNDEEKIKVVLNNSLNCEKNYFSQFDIKSVLGHNIDYILPASMYIKNINKFIMEGKILVLNNKLSFKSDKDRVLLLKIAKALVGDAHEK